MAHILVIDDEADVRRAIRRILAQDGHTVTEADDGDRGLEALRATPVDLVITDIFMPGREGMETIHEIRRTWRDLPIVAISGGTWHGRRAGTLITAAELGAHRTLGKPFTPAELRATVAQCLGVPAGCGR